MELEKKFAWSKLVGWIWFALITGLVLFSIILGKQYTIWGINLYDLTLGLMIGSVVMGIQGRLRESEHKSGCGCD